MIDFKLPDLATILQFDETYKVKLKTDYENYDSGRKYEILKILWDGVFELKEKLAQLRYEQLLEEVEQGKRELATNLYQEAVKSVWDDFESIASGKNIDTEMIQSIRAQITPLIQDKVTPPTPVNSTPAPKP